MTMGINLFTVGGISAFVYAGVTLFLYVYLWTCGGFSRNEINRIQRLVEENREHLLRGWNEYFKD